MWCRLLLAYHCKMPRLRIGLCPTLTQIVLEKLSRIGVHDVVDILTTDAVEVSQKAKVSYKVLNYRPLLILNLLLLASVTREVAALLSPSTLPGELMGCSCNSQGGLTPD